MMLTNPRWLLYLSLCFLLSACSTPPTTQNRTVHQGNGDNVQKVCTEKAPATYTSTVESSLKVALPLAGKTEAQAEGIVKSYLSQQPGGTKRGEDLQNYLFYLCQMANNGGWSEDTTARLVKLFIEKWGTEGREATAPNPRCLQQLQDGYVLKDRIDEEYWSHIKAGTFQDNREAFTQQWNQDAGEWASTTDNVLLQIGGASAKGQFRNAVTPLGGIDATNAKWNGIRNFLQGRLIGLDSICKDLH